MEEIKVLLVDDEEEFSSALAERLSLRGFSTLTSCSGEEALEMIEAEPPQVVVLDKLMPGLSGKDLLARIRSKYPRIAVIVLTGHAPVDSGEMQSGLESFAYLMKPVNIDELIQLISSAVRDLRQDVDPS